MKVSQLLAISVVYAIIALVSISCVVGNTEKVSYLGSLKLDVQELEYIDSFNVENCALFLARDLVAVDGDWFILSSSKGEYNLLFINVKSSEYFYALRRGRGPGEMVQGASLHGNNNGVYFYDVNSAICIRIDSRQSIVSRKVVSDTVGFFNSGASKPVYLTSCGTGFISGNLLDTGSWYSYYDSKGNIISSIESLALEGIIDNRLLSSIMLSSKYASNPDGSKVCVANVFTASISFSEMQSGFLNEYKRYESTLDGVDRTKITPESVCAFQGVCADNNYVYMLYSGHKVRGDVLPSNECRHLIIYDWSGNPVQHYILNRSVSSVCVDGNTLWCASTYPESCIYMFEIPSD